jgi:hypothetical protein
MVEADELKPPDKRIGLYVRIFLGFMAALPIVGWMVYVYHAAHTKADAQEARKFVAPRVALYLEVYKALNPYGAEDLGIQVESFKAGNVEVLLEVEPFESLPGPEREQFLRQLVTTWCEQVDSMISLPSLRIRDIRSGEELASYGCVMNKLRRPFR